MQYFPKLWIYLTRSHLVDLEWFCEKNHSQKNLTIQRIKIDFLYRISRIQISKFINLEVMKPVCKSSYLYSKVLQKSVQFFNFLERFQTHINWIKLWTFVPRSINQRLYAHFHHKNSFRISLKVICLKYLLLMK